MNKSTLIIGGSILLGGAIATGAILNNFDQGSTRNRENNMAEGIEEQNFKDFADEDRYSFCQSREEIKGPYKSSVFGNEKGDIEYVSDDINVFDKEKNKLFILGRKIKYKYSGNAQMQVPSGEGTMNIEESGATVEYYSKFNAPVRIDYNTKIINPAPERKKNDWVVIETKSTGTLLGFTQERDDKEMGDAKTFCPAFALNGAFVSPDYFSFEKSCSEGSSGLGFVFSGNFKFECGGIDNEKGIEMVKEYQEIEKLRDEFNAINEDSENNDPGSEFKDIIPEASPDSSELQKKLQELKDEMKADRTIQN